MTGRKKVLLIAYHYVNKEDTAANRTRGLLTYLPKYGWDVTLITPGLQSQDAKTPNVLFANSIKTRIIPIIRPHYRKFRSYLTTKKTDKISSGDSIKSKTINSKFLNKVTTTFSILFKLLVKYPDSGSWWYHSPVSVAKKELKSGNYDAILSTAAPINAHRIASRLKGLHPSLPWVADFRDLWAGNPYFEVVPWKKEETYVIEKKYLKNADVITTVSAGWEEELIALHNKPVKTIMNGFDPEIFGNTSQLSKKFQIIYAGSLHGNKRDPTILFEVLSELISERYIKKEDLEINIYTGNVSQVPELSAKYNLTECVNFSDFISRDKILSIEKSAQILLLLTWNNQQDAAVFPAKVFEYLAAERPILSIGYQGTCSLADLLDETQAGTHPLTRDELKEQIILWYREYKECGRVIYRGNRDKVLNYSQLGMAKKFAQLLDSVSAQNNVKKRIS